MAENIGFSISKKGYNFREVDEYVDAALSTEKTLRESYASLQEKYDSLYEENSKLREDNERLRGDCTALAVALKQLREQASAAPQVQAEEHIGVEEAQESLSEDRYNEIIAENSALKAEIGSLKAQLEKAGEEQAAVKTGENYSETASKMIAEVAAVVQKLEQDARRKAEAITVAAKLEQEKTKLVKERVSHEVKSLMTMLGSFLDEAEEAADSEE